ncbi:hypothetical protein F2P81_007228 [Scophthalmus maximus]|uniref:Uncharacterized protein n=1 Tax=Scophthalmus maximus TaxID=52904 RepID=A0A6A4TBZ1_SCOMX|nr:hypothetical protein F2P81_007228 [Scophthalmus maximus]
MNGAPTRHPLTVPLLDTRNRVKFSDELLVASSEFTVIDLHTTSEENENNWSNYTLGKKIIREEIHR